MTEILRKRQVSERYSFPLGTLNDWRRKGIGPHSFLIGGRVVYKAEDVEAWIEQQYNAEDSTYEPSGEAV